MTPKATVKSAEKVLDLLNVLLHNFAHGFSPTELAKATDLDPSAITRYVETLERAGFAERIPETGRIRASHRLAQSAVAILGSLNAARARIDESIHRITKPR